MLCNGRFLNRVVICECILLDLARIVNWSVHFVLRIKDSMAAATIISQPQKLVLYVRRGPKGLNLDQKEAKTLLK